MDAFLRPEKCTELVEWLDSDDVNKVTSALNYLLHGSAEWSDSFAILFEKHNFLDLLYALANLLDVVNPLAKDFFIHKTNEENYPKHLIDHTKDEMSLELPAMQNQKCMYLGTILDDNYLLVAVLTILRNLSFEVVNEAYIATNASIMNQYMAILMSCLSHNHLGKCANLVFETMINCGGRIEFTGKRRSVFYGDASLKGRFEVHDRVLCRTQSEYMACIKYIVPFIYAGMIQTRNRELVHKSLELFGKLGTSHENVNVFCNNIPKEIFLLVIELMMVNTTNTDPLICVNAKSTDRQGLHRPPAGNVGKFYSEVCDIETRDHALECVNQMVTMALPKLQLRWMEMETFLPTLFRIIDVQPHTTRTEGIIKAMSILQCLGTRLNLVTSVQHKDEFMRIRSELLWSILGDNILKDSLQTSLPALIDRCITPKILPPPST
jgi:hypothetical protein